MSAEYVQAGEHWVNLRTRKLTDVGVRDARIVPVFIRLPDAALSDEQIEESTHTPPYAARIRELERALVESHSEIMSLRQRAGEGS